MARESVVHNIIINFPIEEVYEFITNPKNTPKWMYFVAKEKTNEWPRKLGTIYYDEMIDGTKYKNRVIEYVENELFTIQDADGSYHDRYRLKKLGPNKTELEHTEWTTVGEIDFPSEIDDFKRIEDVMKEMLKKK